MSGKVDPHADYCRTLEDEIASQLRQVDRTTRKAPVEATALEQLSYLYEWNCKFVDAPDMLAQDPEFSATEDVASGDISRALLQFMLAATPSEDLQQEIMDDPSKFIPKMRVSFEHHMSEQPFFTIENAPDAVNPVKGRLAFVQVPEGDSTTLQLVFKVSAPAHASRHSAYVHTVRG